MTMPLAEIAATVESGLLLLTIAILIGPIVAERFHIPGLVGLIAAGVVFGPFVFGWMSPGGFVATVGAVGLLYLMFLAGVELDIATFEANRKAAITFGLLTFIIPFGLSFVYGLEYLDFSIAGASLIGAMWASHTIVAYPEAKAAGLDKNRAVGSAVASTVITDVLALVILAVASSSTSVADESTATASTDESILPLWLGVILLAIFTLWLLPKLTKWIFVRVGTRTQRFVVVLAGMSAGAFISLLGGIEGLVGAFLAGIGMNRQIPAQSELMERIEFFGASLFIPAFLVSVGLSIDPRTLVEPATLELALIFTGLVVVGKTLAAVISGKIFGFSNNEIGVMASLTFGQAAATLAIAQVGVATGIFGQDILNAAVLTVVFTVLITSFGTRFFARRIEAPVFVEPNLGSRVLVHAPTPEAAEGVLAVATRLASRDGGLVSPFIVAGQFEGDAERLEHAVSVATGMGHDTEGMIRFGTSLAEESRNLALENSGSLLMLPWDGPSADLSFDDLLPDRRLDEVGRASPIPVAAVAVRRPDWSRVIVLTGHYSSVHGRRGDVSTALDLASALVPNSDDMVVVYTSDRRQGADLDTDKFEVIQYQAGSSGILDIVEESDLVVIPPHVAHLARGFGARRIARAFASASLIVVGGPGQLTLSRQQPHQMNLGFAPSRTNP